MSFKTFYFIVVCVFILVFSGCNLDLLNKDKPDPVLYSFFVAGHTYGSPGVNNVGVHPPFKERFDLIRNDESIKFGVLTGDIVYNGTEKNWDEIDEDLKALDKSTYFAVGNHDMTNRALYESRYGPTYKSFIQNSDLHIILDPNMDHWNISGNQLEFLKKVLYNNYEHVDNIFVYFHQVLWREPGTIYKYVSFNSLDYRAETINFWNEVEPLFSCIPNNTYMFAGDVGALEKGSGYMYHKYNNITFIASGMGGGHCDNMVIVAVMKDKTVAFKLVALGVQEPYSMGKIEDYVLP